jgi:hypothetical protein
MSDYPRLHVPAEQLRDHRIEKVWLVVAIDPAENSEGVASWHLKSGELRPMILTGEYALASTTPILPEVARKFGIPIKLLEFSGRKELMTVEPPPPSSLLWTPGKP